MKALEGHYFGGYGSPLPPTISPHLGATEQDPDGLPCRVARKCGSEGKRLSPKPLSGTSFHTGALSNPLPARDMGDSGNQEVKQGLLVLH